MIVYLPHINAHCSPSVLELGFAAVIVFNPAPGAVRDPLVQEITAKATRCGSD